MARAASPQSRKSGGYSAGLFSCLGLRAVCGNAAEDFRGINQKGGGMEITLKVGDKAVYPGYGVGQVVSIEEQSIMGNHLTCYSIQIMGDSGAKIMIPKNRLKTIGVRPLVSKREAEKAISILSEKKPKKKAMAEKNWQKRHQSYVDKIKTGSIYEISEVIRDLNSIKEEKELSYGEKRMMDKAKNILHSELSLIMDRKKLKMVSSLSNPSR